MPCCTALTLRGRTAGDPLKRDEDLVDIAGEIAALRVQIPVERGEGVLLHVHRPGVAALTRAEVDPAVAALNILKAHRDDLAHPQAADPHQQHQGAVTPRGQRREEGAQRLLGDHIGHPLGLPAIQTEAPVRLGTPRTQRVHKVLGEAAGVEQVEFAEE
jgi:hypothetical protein